MLSATADPALPALPRNTCMRLRQPISACHACAVSHPMTVTPHSHKPTPQHVTTPPAAPPHMHACMPTMHTYAHQNLAMKILWLLLRLLFHEHTLQVGTTRMRIASEVWVQAVTEAALTEGIVWGIVLSSIFAMVSVYVFTGSLVVMALAAATMVCINVLVLGLYHAMGWRLGAVEGVSITVLVGLSVDFVIHFSEAFVRSRLVGRRERAQYGPASPPLAHTSSVLVKERCRDRWHMSRESATCIN